MGGAKTKYVCQQCGHHSYQMLGKCPLCATWGSFVEEIDGEEPGLHAGRKRTAVEQRGGQARAGAVTKLAELKPSGDVRWSTGIGELDRVLGGGATAGSFVLIGGDPGIGKSTLLLQTLEQFSKTKKVLYATGEESVEQVKMRADRLGLSGKEILLMAETELERIVKVVREEKPDVLAVDSIQTMFTNELPAAPGSVGQVREVGARLMHLAKSSGILVILVGHVTKDGSIAGPRTLEHMVDTVLYFEASAGQSYRVLRGVKNRFGSTNEIGVFEMAEQGLVEVKNPSALFLAERPKNTPGSVAVSCIEGSRPVLMELQALVTKSYLNMPRRTVLGVDSNRASILLAVMEKKCGMVLYDQDVCVNVAGGLKISETSADLGMIAAVASSFYNKPIDNDCILIGEVGLTGEVRGVARIEERLKEALSMGFKKCILPKANADKLKGKGRPSEIELVPVAQVQQAMDLLFSRR